MVCTCICLFLLDFRLVCLHGFDLFVVFGFLFRGLMLFDFPGGLFVGMWF